MRPELFGRYTLLHRLGAGGMAEVFLARAVSVGGFAKLLAIKRLLPYCTLDQEVIDLLGDEARITVRLTHPNIVQVFDFGRVNDCYYIAMEYVEGLDLKSLIRLEDKKSITLPLDVTLYIMICVLDALEFAHTRVDEHGRPMQIIHRDVSPHNILISREGQIKLTDFGVARAAISLHVSRVGDIKGKFSFMPPEQLFGSEIDHRVDIFAVGAILYEMLSGQQAYRSSSIAEHINCLRGNVVPPSNYVPHLPHALDDICLNALDKDPDRRFPSAGAFAQALREQMMKHCALSHSPSSVLAGLVEQRLSEQRLAISEESGMMTLAEYRLPDNSLLGQTSTNTHSVNIDIVDDIAASRKMQQQKKLAVLKTAILERPAPLNDPDKTQPPLPLPHRTSNEHEHTSLSASAEESLSPLKSEERQAEGPLSPEQTAEETPAIRSTGRVTIDTDRPTLIAAGEISAHVLQRTKAFIPPRRVESERTTEMAIADQLLLFRQTRADNTNETQEATPEPGETKDNTYEEMGRPMEDLHIKITADLDRDNEEILEEDSGEQEVPDEKSRMGPLREFLGIIIILVLSFLLGILLAVVVTIM